MVAADLSVMIIMVGTLVVTQVEIMETMVATMEETIIMAVIITTAVMITMAEVEEAVTNIVYIPLH